MTRPARLIAALVASAALLAGGACLRVNVYGEPPADREPMPDSALRLATYNVSLYSDRAGGLIQRLQSDDPGARKVAAVLQQVRPDVVLLNEFDYDAGGRAADLFQHDYLGAPQPGGGDPLHYPFRYFAPVNTGVPSGLDLDGDGRIGGEGRAGGNDAWGYGLHPGQYGMLLLSRYPIDTAGVRTFQHLRWSAMPGARRPVDPDSGEPWHPDAVWTQLRLSSKSHWDIPVRTPAGVLHVLASHPTPPVFDGPEDRNGARNADEIRLWSDYISGQDQPWLCDDAGGCGGLGGSARFVILGDLNNDPVDGDGRREAIQQLLRHPRVLRHPTPSSQGAVAAARLGSDSSAPRRGDPAHATGDFGSAGLLRLDYALPSTGLAMLDAGVFWPPPGDPTAVIVDGTDHRLVWVDVRAVAMQDR